MPELRTGKSVDYYADDKGSVILTRLQPGYVLAAILGYASLPLVEYTITEFQKEVTSAGFVVIFGDARNTRGFSPEGRDRVSQWITAYKPRVRSHVLFRSGLMSMAVAMVNLMTGGVLKTFSDVASFERAISNEVRGFKHLPTYEQEQQPNPKGVPR